MTENLTGFGGLGVALDDFTTIRFIAQQVMNGMATATLVEIMRVDGQTVDVRPLVNQIDGKNTGIPHETIHGLPWLALQSGAAVIRAVPKVGDKGMAAFCHSDTSTVKATKGCATPPTRRRYSWSDGVYLGGLPLLNEAPTTFIDVSDEGVTITSPAGITLNGDVQHTGNWTTTGTITGETDVVGNGTSLHGHKHGSVQTGSSQTSSPV